MNGKNIVSQERAMNNTKAVIYARFSSSAQREESIDTQIRECQVYAKKHGMTVINVYQDKAKSGRTANRPSFQRMIRDSESKTFDAVLLYTIDRFARNRFDAAYYKAKLKENGVKVYRFTPGFVQSKVFLADDRQAVVGSVNLDYRSLTLHFENACMFVDHPVIPAVKQDFEETFPRCEPVTVKKRRFDVLYDLYLGLLRLFAPLL